MPQLDWNELDFLDCLGVEPFVADDAVSHDYEVHRAGLRLLVTVWQLESVIQVSLFRDKQDDAVFTFAVYARGPARFINDQRGRYLEIEDCIVAPSRFWHIEAGNVFDRNRYPHAVTVRIAVDPDIRIAVVGYESRT